MSIVIFQSGSVSGFVLGTLRYYRLYQRLNILGAVYSFFYKLTAVIILSLVVSISPAHAAKKKHRRHTDFTLSDRYAALVVNSATGEVIYHKNAKALLYPASLTKMMTIYLAFQAIDSKELSFEDKLPVSVRAASMPKMNIRLKPGQYITVRDAILALIVHSANDAAVVLAEALGGSEEAFAHEMTLTAQSLGMKDTKFMNASGLYNEEQVTTAYDMAKLAIALRRDYNKYYHMFSTKAFSFKGRVINAHNRVMHRYPWADGLKTGYINASGFNLVTSANRNDIKLVGVVMGGSSAYARDTHMIQLLEYAYDKIGIAADYMTASDNRPSRSMLKRKDIFEVAQVNGIGQPNYQSDVFSGLLSSDNEIKLDSSNAETDAAMVKLAGKRFVEPAISNKGNVKTIKRSFKNNHKTSAIKIATKLKKKAVVIPKKRKNNV